jgi:CRISPR-associated endonuclease/helicase Cas3
MNEIEYRKLWAKSKPYLPLLFHMVDVGNVTKTLLSEKSVFEGVGERVSNILNIDKDECKKLLSFLFATHDIGKCHPDFQRKAPSLEVVENLINKKYIDPFYEIKGFRHEYFSGEWMEKYFGKFVNEEVAEIFRDVLKLHHQKSTSDGIFYKWYYGEEVSRWWENAKVYHLKEIRKVFNFDPNLKIDKPSDQTELGALLTGLLILSDWIASNSDFYPELSDFEQKIESYTCESEKIAQKAIRALGLFVEANFKNMGSYFLDIWPSFSQYSLRSLQSTVESLVIEKKIGPGLVILEAPMGEGKTETAIYLAMQWLQKTKRKGIYFALPTATTSNQMYKRINDFLKDEIGFSDKARLMHSMAWIIEDDFESWSNVEKLEDKDFKFAAQKWLAPSRVGLLKAWAVGTIDQAMSAALQIRFGVLRWIGLSQKILIIDEVHAYDVYMETIIERLIRWCGALKIPVILLSATLPQKRKSNLLNAYSNQKSEKLNAGYPSISYVSEDSPPQVFEVKGEYKEKKVYIDKVYLLHNWKDLAKEIVMKFSVFGGAIGIILNTITDAQELYLEIENEVENMNMDIECILFHGRFIKEDRQRIENKCLEIFDKRSITQKRKNTILVATQVVEQSLDLDFDYVISAIAPMDLLLQRMGRLHRHDGRIRDPQYSIPRIQILLPASQYDYKNNGKVYENWILCKTQENLPDEIIIPRDIQDLIESVYNDKLKPKNDIEKSFLDHMNDNFVEQETMAEKYLLGKPSKKEFTLNYLSKQQEDDEREVFKRAKTRIGEESVTIVLVSEEDCLKYQKLEIWSRDLQKELLKKSVAISYWKAPSEKPVDGYQKIDQGKGALVNATLIPLKGGEYRWKNKDGIKWKLELNSKLGVVIRKEDV